MPDIHHEVSEWFHHRHDQAATAAPPQPQETDMSKLADAKNAIDIAAAKLGSIAGNPLLEQLAEEGLGAILGPADVSSVIAIVRTIENAKRVAAQQAAAPLAPAGTGAQPVMA